jgi:hypothetical protein
LQLLLQLVIAGKPTRVSKIRGQLKVVPITAALNKVADPALEVTIILAALPRLVQVEIAGKPTRVSKIHGQLKVVPNMDALKKAAGRALEVTITLVVLPHLVQVEIVGRPTLVSKILGLLKVVPNMDALNKAEGPAQGVTTTPVVLRLAVLESLPLAKPHDIGIVASHLAHGLEKHHLPHLSNLAHPTGMMLLVAMKERDVMAETLSLATTKFHLSKTTLLTVLLLLLLLEKVNTKPVVHATN